jgi:DNA invertase Pin-like site-specific DNA recombinase
MIELRGAIYARRSKDLSTESQVERVQNYMAAVERRLSNEFGEPVRIVIAPGFVFRDEGQSGLTFERTDYARLRQAITARALDVLAIYATDRLGRPDDPTDMLLERRACVQAGVRVFAEVGDYEVTGADEMTVIRFFLESVFAGRELRATLRRTREGQQAAWQRDNRHYSFGGDTRYGLRLDTEKHIVEDPDRAAILRQMVAWVLDEGLNGAEIAARLNMRDIPAPMGPTWWPRTVHRILKDPSIAGGGVTVTAGGQRYQIASPALIDPGEFRALQRVLAAQSRPRGKEPDIYPLSGVMLCNQCKQHFTGFRSRGRYAWYRCRGRAKSAQFGPCDMPILRKNIVEAPIWAQIATVLSDPSLLQEAFGNDLAEAARVEEELGAVRTQLERKIRAQSRLVTDWSETMDARAIKLSMDGLTREINNLDRHLAELEYRLMILRRQTQPRDYNNVDLGQLPPEGRMALIREIVHSVLVRRVEERRVVLHVRYYPVNPTGQGLTGMPEWVSSPVEVAPIVLDL